MRGVPDKYARILAADHAAEHGAKTAVDRRARYAAAIRDTDGWVLDDGQHMLDAVMAVADAEQAELRAEVQQWQATFGRDALPGALRRLERAEADRATVLNEAADAIVADNDRQMWASKPGKHWAADLLRRMAAEAQPTPVESTADRAAALGMSPTEYREHSHTIAVQQIRDAAQGLFAGTAIRVMDALEELAAEAQQPVFEDAELTAEEARALADELGADLYQAQDALAFVGECCDIADREQQPITTADVREWVKGARCGRQLAADAAEAQQPAPAETETVTTYLLEHRWPEERTWKRGTPGLGLRVSWQDRTKAGERLADARERYPHVEHRMVTVTTTVHEQITDSAPAETEEPTP